MNLELRKNKGIYPMTTKILEPGPQLFSTLPDFRLPDCYWNPHELGTLMGKQGILLSFISDIWHPSSVRRILWLRHHMPKFMKLGVNVAVIVRDDAKMLYGFEMSSPLPIPFQLLADTRGDVHDDYDMVGHNGLLLLNKRHVLRAKWIVPEDRVWVKFPELESEMVYLQKDEAYASY